MSDQVPVMNAEMQHEVDAANWCERWKEISRMLRAKREGNKHE